MLFVLTGEIQSGKTRWLQGTLGGLGDMGVTAYGVIAPGRWLESTNADGTPTFEKLGIDNVLLPGGQTVSFATRRDLVDPAAYDAGCKQAGKLQLGWAISDEAVARVNAHFDEIASVSAGRGLLVVDELGRLEVERGLGLTSALRLLAEGPRDSWQHALVVVRDYLAEMVVERFAPAWGGATLLSPGPDAASRLSETFA